jgi:subtilisin family serine protease
MTPMPQINDPRFLNQWALEKIRAEYAWKQVVGRSNVTPVTVAIVDWGVQQNHLAFGSGLVLGGARVVPPESGDFSDDNTDGHGTMLAGIIGGVAPYVRLLAVKFIDARTTPNAENAAKAIRFALSQKTGPMVINASWDVSVDDPSLAGAIEEARAAGVPVVAGAGNDGRDNDQMRSPPATYANPDPDAQTFSNLISVMASDEGDKKPEFSNYGETKVHLAAPGTRIISTSSYFGDTPQTSRGSPYSPGFFLYDGTSAAAAFVSAAAAMILSVRADFTPKQIRDRLISSADRCDSLNGLCKANGRLNLSNALLLL